MESSTLNLKDLSPADRKKLLEQLKAEEANAAQKTIDERKAYKDLVNETIPVLFKQLQKASNNLSVVKTGTFNGLKTLIEMKSQVFERDQDQYTHTFTTDSGITLKIGHRTYDNWDDTVTAGIKKVDDYLESLISDASTATLVGIIRDLLTKDKKGNLNSKNVLKLRKKANEIGDPVFIDAVNIILDSFKPTKGAAFVTVTYRNIDDNIISADLPLDITSAPFIENQ